MQSISALLEQQGTSGCYINLQANPVTLPSHAIWYSQISLQDPRLQELCLDDFYSTFNGWCLDSTVSCEDLLQLVIDNVKRYNPGLKFGITLYTEELPSALLNPHLTPFLRMQVDTVHLYVMHRQEGLHFEDSVRQVAAAFPNATVLAGVYAYDRIHYASCSGSDDRPCSTEEELLLFQQTLTIQVRLAQKALVAGLEFYPGFFGLEDRWHGWNAPCNCEPERRQDCIDNTRAMHEATLRILRGS